ncbi:MAG: hypothetical protein HZB23_06310 [Deltaproteobacteria bacterium]|nr:hypothetical protein [Deltaproteobacteria bacterium]
MKRTTGIGVIIMLVVFPALALGGMVLMDEEMEFEGVTGQVGMTVNMSMNLTASTIAWGDSDGFGTYTTAAWLIYNGVTLPTIALSNVVVDVGTGGGVSYVALETTGNIITGNLTIQSIIVGSSATSTTQSLGELRIAGMAVSFGTIRISGHANP